MDFKQFCLCDELVLGKHFWLEIFSAVTSSMSHNLSKKLLLEMPGFAILKNGTALSINSHWKHSPSTNKLSMMILARSTVMKLISKKLFTGSMNEQRRKPKNEIHSELLSPQILLLMNWRKEKNAFFQELWKIA